MADEQDKAEAEKAKLEKAVAEALDKLGLDASTNPDAAKNAANEMAGKMPSQMLDLFAMVVEQAKAKQTAKIVPEEAAPATPAAPAEPSAFESAVQSSVKKAIEGYVQANVVTPDTKSEITMDAEFLKTHGPGLVASMVQGFAQAIIPEKFEVAIDQPTATTDQGAQADAPVIDGEKKTVQLKVDFGNLIGGFLSNLARNINTAPAPEAPAPKPDVPGDN